ncbi:MAG: STAS domain-containing protein [Planctomycetes bacterium]|nr:STAS domain-containing protein [Planctomycetota bacterium]
MAVENWSESVLLGELADDPQYTDDLSAIIEQCNTNRNLDVLLNFGAVSYLNSSNIAKLLKLRKLVNLTNERKLKLCGISRQVWGVFLVTGLDRIFEICDDVPTGLASLQIES